MFFPGSDATRSTVSGSSVHTFTSSEPHHQIYGYPPLEDDIPREEYIERYTFPVEDQTGFSTPRAPNTPTARRCLFWFTGCNQFFNDDFSTWYPHVMEHLAPLGQDIPELQTPLPCSLCTGQVFDTWYLVLSHAFEHIRSGQRRPGVPEVNLVNYLTQQRIITSEDKTNALAALEAPRRAPIRIHHNHEGRRHRNTLYYDEPEYHSEPRYDNMAYAIRHMGPPYDSTQHP
jgi:hypothetical protein